MHLDPSAFLAAPELIDALLKHATPVACPGDRVLFRQGQNCKEGLYLLQSGEVTMSLEGADGVDLWSVNLSSGSILGLPALLGQAPYSMTAIAKSDAEIYFVSKEAFSAQLMSEPSLALIVLRIMAAEVQGARGALIGATGSSNPTVPQFLN